MKIDKIAVHEQVNALPKDKTLHYFQTRRICRRHALSNEQFFLFTQCFLPFGELCAIFIKFGLLSSAKSFSFEEAEICRLGKGLNFTKRKKKIMY